jgi:hypothetical protein
MRVVARKRGRPARSRCDCAFAVNHGALLAESPVASNDLGKVLLDSSKHRSCSSAGLTCSSVYRRRCSAEQPSLQSSRAGALFAPAAVAQQGFMYKHRSRSRAELTCFSVHTAAVAARSRLRFKAAAREQRLPLPP